MHIEGTSVMNKPASSEESKEKKRKREGEVFDEIFMHTSSFEGGNRA